MGSKPQKLVSAKELVNLYIDICDQILVDNNLNQNNKSKWQEVKNGLKLIDKKKNLIYCLSNLNWILLRLEY